MRDALVIITILVSSLLLRMAFVPPENQHLPRPFRWCKSPDSYFNTGINEDLLLPNDTGLVG